MKLTSRKFHPQLDEHLFKRFALDRGHHGAVSLEFLPPFGIVVANGSMPICVGFLIKCDNGMGIFSDFLSHPLVEREIRNAAVEKMREELAMEARKSGLKFVTSFTKHRKLAIRLESLGFKRMGEFIQMGRILWR